MYFKLVFVWCPIKYLAFEQREVMVVCTDLPEFGSNPLIVAVNRYVPFGIGVSNLMSAWTKPLLSVYMLSIVLTYVWLLIGLLDDMGVSLVASITKLYCERLSNLNSNGRNVARMLTRRLDAGVPNKLRKSMSVLIVFGKIHP